MLFVRCEGGISHNPPKRWRSTMSELRRACFCASSKISHRCAENVSPEHTTTPCRRAITISRRASRRAERFLAELVKVPSDNPPGDCAPHAARAAALLEAMGFAVERHAVPPRTSPRTAWMSCTNLVVRVRFGAGAR